jgi:hypothetical protein
MNWEERRALVQMVFGGKTPGGERLGVYIAWIDGEEDRRQKRWRYKILGHLVEQWGTLNVGGEADPEREFSGGAFQQDLLDQVVTSLPRC